MKTPQIDSIAANGVRCTAGYVTAPQCCPSRAGLITGRYQNRFGFEVNFPMELYLQGRVGLPPGEATIADRLKAAGYATGIVGKWHLGDTVPMRPCQRGFAEAFWHPNGGVLFPDAKTGFLHNLWRNNQRVQSAEYSTDAFGREAVRFIERHQREPFFLYLSFVAPHWPMEAKPEHLARFAHVPDLHRRTFLAMMASLDENVGRVLAKLREAKLDENTLVFFLSDNGGQTGPWRARPDAPFHYGVNTSRNAPCRGEKGDLLEGGIRVPFLVQWKGRVPAGKVYDRPVISLDIAPTALGAAGVKPGPDGDLDGTNLLPFLSGGKQGEPHNMLCWRFRFPSDQPAYHRWAVRQGDWKLVKNATEPLSLYNLAADIGETKSLAAQHTDKVRELETAWQRWNAEMKAPLWESDARGRLPSRKASLPPGLLFTHQAGTKLGEKATLHRFQKLRAGGVKTAKGWNVQDFASSFFNPNAEPIAVAMKMVSDDPKFVFANGQVGTYTKTVKLRPMQGDTDNIYIGSPTFGKPDWPVLPMTNFTGSVEFTGSKPFYYYFLRETEAGEAADATAAYFAAWKSWRDDVPAPWDADLKQFVIPYTNYWRHEKNWPIGWHSQLTLKNGAMQPVTYTLKHIPYYGGQFNPKNGQITRYREQVVQVVLQKEEEEKATLQDLFGWATDQMSSMEGCLLIRPSPLEAKADTAIRLSVLPNDSGERLHDAIR